MKQPVFDLCPARRRFAIQEGVSPKFHLTHAKIASAKAAPGERLEWWDEATPGLCLRVSERGPVAWVLRYHSRNGGQPRFRFGDPRVMDLKEARTQAWRLKDQIAAGNEPRSTASAAEKAAEAAEAIKTFGQLLDAYEAACAIGEWKPKFKRKRPQTIAFEKDLAVRHIRPRLGELQIAEVNRAEVKALLRGMIAKDIGAQTNRVHAIIRQAFNWAIAEELVNSNPAMGFAAFHHAMPRQRIWADEELKRLWPLLRDPKNLKDADSNAVHVSRPVAIALQLCAILLNRRAEVAGMQTTELNLDAATWLIPAERMKGNKPHQVALPPHAVALIREAMALAKGDDDDQPPVVFPSPRDKNEAIKPLSLTHAMAKLRTCINVDGAHIHDLRRTGATAMTSERLGISPHIRSQVLGHGSDAGGGAAVSATFYDVNDYLPEKRRALEAWENLLLQIVGERAAPSTCA
jgi:integrase